MEKELCWCGSGKAYEDCHKLNDDKIAILAKQGKEVPQKDMIKTPAQIEAIRKACALNTAALDEVSKYVKAGVTTGELDRIMYDFIVAHGGMPGDLGYYGFPKSVTISVNDVVCHGIPGDKPYDVLKSGDIVNIDCTTVVDGYYGDASRMFCIGKVNKKDKELVDITYECLKRGIAAAQPWGYLGDIGAAIAQLAHKHGFSVVEEFGGHGVGLDMHEDPFVAHYGKKKTGMVLVPGMVITIEPMINAGRKDIYEEEDGWTIRTCDGKKSAQWEHTILITEKGAEILSY